MWSHAARRGGFALLQKFQLYTLSSSPSCRSFSSPTNSSPLSGEGLKFQTQSYPSFWSRLKQQKQGLGNMALSASIAFLAMSIIKLEKELKQSRKLVDGLKKQNHILQERLDSMRAVLDDEGELKDDRTLLALLREVVDLNGEALVGEQVPVHSSGKTDNSPESPGRSKFMV